MEVPLQPLVSIIIPVYNTEPYLRICLESVAAQTYKIFECIIVLDGTPDNSIKIGKEFAEKDPRFMVYEKKNGGLASARNYGLIKASGAYVAFLDSDDAWKKEKLAHQIQIFNNHPEIDLVYSNCEINDSGRIKSYTGAPYANNPLELLFANTITGSGSSVIMKKEIFNSVGGFNETLKSFEDLEYWFRVALRGHNFLFCPLVDVVIYTRRTSLSHNKSGMRNANAVSFRLQLNQLHSYKFRLKLINEASLKRIYGSRKYFERNSPFKNYMSLTRMLLIYIMFLINYLHSRTIHHAQ